MSLFEKQQRGHIHPSLVSLMCLTHAYLDDLQQFHLNIFSNQCLGSQFSSLYPILDQQIRYISSRSVNFGKNGRIQRESLTGEV